jgi:hypothetical protein
LLDTSGNEFSHELGHDHGLGHYPGGGKWSTHNPNSGWGYDAFYQRMIGNLAWKGGVTNNVEGYVTPPWKDLFGWNQDAMASGWPDGALSVYTHHTGYSAKRIQDTLNKTPIIDQGSPTGYSVWNDGKQGYEPYDAGAYPKPVKSGIPVITLLGQYDPELKLPGIIYPALFGSWGRTFDLPKPNPGNTNVCWLDVTYPDRTLKVDLQATRHKSSVMNRFAVNLPMEPFPESASVSCKRGGQEREIDRIVMTRPSALPQPPAIVGKSAGFGVAQVALLRELRGMQGTPALSLFAERTLETMSEEDLRDMPSPERETATRYLRLKRGVAEVNRWAAAYAKEKGDAPVTVDTKQELAALLQRYELSLPSVGGMIKIANRCVIPDPNQAEGTRQVFTTNCTVPEAQSWLMDKLGRIHTLTRPQMCLGGEDVGSFGLPLVSCDDSAQRWVLVSRDGNTFVQRSNDGHVLDRSASMNRLTHYGYHGGTNQRVAGLKTDDGALLALALPETLAVVDRIQKAQGVPSQKPAVRSMVR